jgi:hypothetical protein
MYIVAAMTLNTIVAFDTTVAFVTPCPADVIVHDVAQRTSLEFLCTPKSTPFESRW